MRTKVGNKGSIIERLMPSRHEISHDLFDNNNVEEADTKQYKIVLNQVWSRSLLQVVSNSESLGVFSLLFLYFFHELHLFPWGNF